MRTSVRPEQIRAVVREPRPNERLLSPSDEPVLAGHRDCEVERALVGLERFAFVLEPLEDKGERPSGPPVGRRPLLALFEIRHLEALIELVPERLSGWPVRVVAELDVREQGFGELRWGGHGPALAVRRPCGLGLGGAWRRARSRRWCSGSRREASAARERPVRGR